MSVNYNNLKKHPKNFRDVTGLTIEECEKIVEKVMTEWEKTEKQNMVEDASYQHWRIKYSVVLSDLHDS